MALSFARDVISDDVASIEEFCSLYLEPAFAGLGAADLCVLKAALLLAIEEASRCIECDGAGCHECDGCGFWQAVSDGPVLVDRVVLAGRPTTSTAAAQAVAAE